MRRGRLRGIGAVVALSAAAVVLNIAVGGSSAVANLAPDPDFEVDPSAAYFTNGPCAFAWSTEQSRSPTHSLKIASSTNTLCRWLSNTGSIPATPGTTYNASVYLKTVDVSPAGGAKFALLFYAGSTFTGDAVESATLGGTNDWTQESFQVTAPAGTTSIRLEIRLNGPGTVYADDIFLASATGNPPSPPTVNIVSTVPSTVGAAGSSTITWNGSANGAFSVRRGGSTCSDGTQLGTGTYLTSPNNTTSNVNASDLATGSNTIRICLTDSNGNTGSATTMITKDLNTPVVTIVSAVPSTVNAAGSSTLTWHASKNGSFSVRVGGTSCSTGTQIDSGSYSTSPADRTTNVAGGGLAEGPNTVRVCLTDAVSNEGSATTTITKDTSVPVVTIVSAVPSTVDGAPSSTVTWNANENGAFSVRVGGSNCSDGTQLSSGNYSTSPNNTTSTVNSSDLSPGANTIRVCVTDAGTNTGSATVTIQKTTGGGGFSNVAADADFEQNPDPFYYTNGPCTFSWSTEQSRSPSHSLKIASSTSSLCRWLSNTTGTPASAGTTYFASVYFKTVGIGPAGSTSIAIDFFNSSATYLGVTCLSPGNLTGTSDWTLRSVQCRAPAGTAFVRVEFRLNGPGNLYGDDLVLGATSGVNQPPSFDLPANPNQAVGATAGPQSVPNFATNISPGPPDEAGQTVSFLVSNDNNALFTGQPAISPSGTLSYTPDATKFGSATVTVRAMDNGGTAGGGNDTSAPKTFTITTSPPNAAPVLANIEGTPVAYTENDPATQITNTLTVSDADSPNLAGATVSITGGFAGAEDVLALSSPPAGITVVGYSGGVLTLSGSATPSSYQAALRAVTYRNTSDNPSTATRTIGFQVDDGAAVNHLSNVASRQVTVTAVNDAPVLANIEGTPLAYMQSESAKQITAALTVADADSPNLAGATIAITSGFNAEDVLALSSPPAGITVVGYSGGVLTLSGSASLNSYQNALRAVTYFNDTANSTATRTVSFRVDDGAASNHLSNVVTRDIQISAPNRPPSFTKGPDLTNVFNQNNDGSPRAYTINPWATAISAGPGESGQTVDFVIDSVTPANLFTVQPAVSASGVLTFTTNPANIGTATIVLHAHDDGGTANGGINTSPTQSFTIQTQFPPPIAVDDAYTATGNIGLNVDNTAEGVLQRGTDDTLFGATITNCGATNSASMAVSGGSCTTASASGGYVTLSTDGTFTYDPPPGFIGTDHFFYKLTNSSGSAVGDVSIVISDMIWFVDNSQASAGDGRLSHPFNTLNGFASINNGTGTHPATGQTAFLYTGSGNYTGGVTLLDNQYLIGQGASASILAIDGITLAPFSRSLPSTGGINPTITNSGGAGITLGQNNTIRGVTIDGTSAAAITGSGINALAVGSDVIDKNAGGDALSLTGAGSGTVSFAAPITNPGGHAINITGRTGGTVTISGAISASSGTGANLSGNTGATINFTGGITVSTGANSAFHATGGGTVSVDNSGVVNTLATTSGTALDVEHTTIGSPGLKFLTISAGTAAGSAGDGILLDATGSTAGLTVAGTGAPGSGGTIQHKTGADGSTVSGVGIYLNDTRAVSLASMSIHDNQNFGILGSNVTGFTLAGTTVSGNGDNSGSEDGILFMNLLGTGTITNVDVSGSARHNIAVINTSGTLTSLAITGSTIHDNGATGSNGLTVIADGTAVMNGVSVSTTTFTNNHSAGIQAQTLNGGSLAITVTGLGTAPTDAVTFANNFNAVDFDHASNTTGTLTTTLTNAKITNTLSGCAGALPCGAPINLFLGSLASSNAASIFRATVTNNAIDAGATESAPGIWFHTGNPVRGHARLLISGNNVSNDGDRGISVEGGGCTVAQTCDGTVDATITNNAVLVVDPLGLQAIFINDGTNVGDTQLWCADISGNDALGITNNIRVRQRQSTGLALPGYGGTKYDAAAVKTYLDGRNPLSLAGLGNAADTSSLGPGFTNAGTACLLP